MATTSLWAVKGWLGKLVVYVENPNKTENPRFFEQQDITHEQAQGLSDVINYAIQTKKTTEITHDENETIIRRFVTGVNCGVVTARQEMMALKKHHKKTEGVVAYHGYQSFSPGEATPEIAHEIGIKLAKKLWGNRHQVIVATHLDKGNHLHNHFLLNNVSFVDGKKFYRSEKDYADMMRESDALCREYGLTVIENPERGKSKHYAEWQAEKRGEPTYRSMIKADVDEAIRQSMTERQFFDNLRKMGYQIKQGQDITLRYIGRDKGLKLKRNFGDEYTIERIRERILAQDKPERIIIPPNPPPKKMHYTGSIGKISKRKMTGLRALYFYYLYRLGVFPQKYQPNPKRVYFLFREDIRHIQNISKETRLLVKYEIDTDVQLTTHKNQVINQINILLEDRRQLRNLERRVGNANNLPMIKARIATLSEQLNDLRREVKHCENIEKRSCDMKSKLQQARENEKNKTKELVKDDPFRRRR